MKSYDLTDYQKEIKENLISFPFEAPFKCPRCDFFCYLTKEEVDLVVRKQPVIIEYYTYECLSCLEKYTNDPLDNFNLKTAYAAVGEIYPDCLNEKP